MKLLLILLVVLLLVWLWRGNRRAAPPSPRRKPPPQDVVACAFCGLHLPVAEAVPGMRGVYCCLDHRRQREA